MIAFVARRVLLGIVTIFGVITVTFFIVSVVPSDPVGQWAGPRATEEQRAKARAELGLDKPLPVRYAMYVRQVVSGDLGRSLRTHQPVVRELGTYLPATLELVLLSMAFAVLIGLPLGVLSAQYKNSWIDHLSRLLSIGMVSIPVFWFALFLQLFFYRRLGWLPLGDQLSTETRLFGEVPHVTGFLLLDSVLTANVTVLTDALRHMVLPALVLAAYPIGLTARMTRSALLEILGEDYIVAARSYGTPERVVMWAYALKNSLGPTVTVLTLGLGFALVNTFLVESIFSWPGIGSYIATSVVTLDFPAIMGITLFSAVTYVLLNTAADIVIAFDPRVRL